MKITTCQKPFDRFPPVALLIVFLLICSKANALVTIMPMGDSITCGGGIGNAPNQSGYRDQLFADLTARHVDFKFTGVSSTAQYASPKLLAAGDAGHNGYGAYTLGNLWTNIAGTTGPAPFPHGGSDNMGGYWLTGGGGTGRGAVTPDVVLLMAGINDIYQGHEATNSYLSGENYMTDILRWLKTNRTSTSVFVGAVTPVTNGILVDASYTDNWNRQIGAFNSWLKTNVPSYGPHYHFVDNYSPFFTNGVLNTNALSIDGLHPNAAGYILLGNAWDDALSKNGIR